MSSPEKKRKIGKKKFKLAVDIETIGKEAERGILAVGLCFGKDDGTIIEKRAFCSKVPPPEKFEKHCWEQFWSKFPEQLARIDACAVDDHIGKFHAFLLELEQKYGPFGRKHNREVELRLVSDNPGFDISRINFEFYRRGFPVALAEMFSDYVPTDDPTEQERGLTQRQAALVQSFITAPHDHFPSNDAAQIYQRMCAVKLVLDCTEVNHVKEVAPGDYHSCPETDEHAIELVEIDLKRIEAARASFNDIETAPACKE